jgi:hypothetical protein
MHFSSDTPRWKRFIFHSFILTAWTYYEWVDKINLYRHKRKIKRILKNNKDIAELSKLAGINEQN